MKKYFVATHLGLGDHFTCNGMVRELYKNCDLMVLVCKENNIKVVTRMFSDLPNLHLLPIVGAMDYSDTQHMQDVISLKSFFEKRGYEITAVGEFNSSTFIRGDKKYDEVFYDQVNIPFEKRWSSFYYPRNKGNEDIMYYNFFDRESNPEKYPMYPPWKDKTNKLKYIFLHDDPNRGRVIDRELIPRDIEIITPHKKFWDADILDYRPLLEHAYEIHCVNSSFADLMDSFDLSKVK